jgi:antitoxin MazE
MRVAKWGNSLAVRLPDAIVKTLKLKSGDEIEIVVTHEPPFGLQTQ